MKGRVLIKHLCDQPWARCSDINVVREIIAWFQMGEVDWYTLSMTRIETTPLGIGLEEKNNEFSLCIINLGLR